MRDLTGELILVLDGEERSALATVRSLGSRGAYVIVGASSKYALSLGVTKSEDKNTTYSVC